MTDERKGVHCGHLDICSNNGDRNLETGCCTTCPLKPGGSMHTLANGLRWHRKSPR